MIVYLYGGLVGSAVESRRSVIIRQCDVYADDGNES